MSDALKVINLDGAVSIREAGSIKERIAELLRQKMNIIINFANIEAVDLSCLQIIIAAKKTAARLGLTIQISNQVSKEALFSFYVCGLTSVPASSGKEINKSLDELVGGHH